MKRFNKLWVIPCFFLASCHDVYKTKYQNMKAEEIYKVAHEHMKISAYPEAADEFLEIERQFPYSELAIRGRIMGAYCYYRSNNFREAVRNLKIFIAYHPVHKNIDYAYYLLGMSLLGQITTSQRSTDVTTEARDVFRLIVNRFKTSIYFKDSYEKMRYLNDILANYEMNVGRYYQSDNNFIAALPRFQSVINNHSETAVFSEAIFRVIESLVALGLTNDAVKFYNKYSMLKNDWMKRAAKLLNIVYKH